MRGISFSTSNRYESKPFAAPSASSSTASAHSAPAPPATTSALRIMKKLSTTFRRKTSVSQRPPPSTTPPSSPKYSPKQSPIVHQATHKPTTVHAPRAMTFSVPSRNHNATPAAADIPFFGDRRTPGRPSATKVTVMRGHPAPAPTPTPVSPTDRRPASPLSGDPLSSETASDGRLSVPSAAPLSKSSARKVSPPILREANRPLDDNRHQKNGSRPTSRHRYFSFDADTSRKADVAYRQRRNVVQALAYASNPSATTTASSTNPPVRPCKRRWLMPRSETADKPRLFTPTQSTAFSRITRHRDRAEARTLVSACTFLEAEIDRLAAHLHTHTNFTPGRNVSPASVHNGPCPAAVANRTVEDRSAATPVCVGEGVREGVASHHCSASCAANCPLSAYLPAAIDRLRAVLFMLEERYDTIEQVYVKSEEYARAMGRFFNVTPDQFTKIVQDKETNTVNTSNRDNRKSFR